MATPLKKDQKVNTSDGIARVKPIKTLEDGKTQNMIVKKSDGSTVTTRYANGKVVDTTYNPKKMRPKKPKKLRNKRLKPIKPGKSPDNNVKLPRLDAQDKAAMAKIEKNKKLADQYNKRNKGLKGKINRLVKNIKNIKLKGGVSGKFKAGGPLMAKFTPHMMHKDGKSVKANTYAKHLELKKKGYTHSK